MSLPFRPSNLGWILTLLVAVGFVGWTAHVRVERIEQVTALAQPPLPHDPQSVTGYAGGVRQLIVPERNLGSYQWITQAQQILARGAWRSRHADYDNAPFGREVRSASLFRWWLAAVARINQAATGNPAGIAVERAALWSGVGVQVLILVVTVVVVARRFGALPASVAAFGLCVMFPLAGAFLPGQPDDQALVLGSVLATLLALLIGVRSKATSRWFVASGVAAGITLWLDVSVGVAVAVGIAAGAMGGRGLAGSAGLAPRSWQRWSLAGAITVLAAFGMDYYASASGFPSLDAVHPLYGLAWLGLGVWLEEFATPWPQVGSPRRQRWLRLALAAAAIVSVSLLLGWGGAGTWLPHPLDTQLSAFGTPTAGNLAQWLRSGGGASASIALLAPLLLLAAAAYAWLRPAHASQRLEVLLMLGPVLVSVGYAMATLRGWAVADAALIALVVAVVPKSPVARPTLLRWGGGVAAALAFSLMVVFPRMRGAVQENVTPSEVESLVERDLAHWLVARTGSAGPTVLAPPEFAASLAYYGGGRAVSTPYPENIDGFTAAARIAGAALPDEAYALVRRRELTHILIPSWDDALDDYARVGATTADKTFLALLHRWLPPRWLRPIPYELPAITGFEGRSVVVFEVVELQDDAYSLSYMAEYFVETRDLDSAAKVADALAHLFPDHPSALIARAVVERTRGNSAGLARVFAALSPQLATAAVDGLPWDRRVVLAVVLAEAKRVDAARTVLRRCLAEADEPQLRTLTTGTLFRLLALNRALGEAFPDAGLEARARLLLPSDLREQLGGPGR